MTTRSRRNATNPSVLQEEAVHQLRIDRIRQGQDEEQWIVKLMPVQIFPDRPTLPVVVDDAERLDFDVALLLEDRWDRALEEGEYEVEKISDVRTGRRTRYGRALREFKVHWRGYEDPTRATRRISTAARCCASSCKIGRSGAVFR